MGGLGFLKVTNCSSHLYVNMWYYTGIPNSRKLELLSMATLTSPAILKQRVGTSRTYIRPVQRDLDLKPIEDLSDTVSVLTSDM